MSNKKSLLQVLVETHGVQKLHDALTPREREALRYCWPAMRRPLIHKFENVFEGQEPPPEPWQTWLILAGRGWGKALALDTPIITPSGWATMKDLKIGDKVFDEKGNECFVTNVFDVQPEESYRLFFSDGTHIDACGDHQWITLTHRDRKQAYRYKKDLSDLFLYGSVKTTNEIINSFYQYGARKDLNHCVPVTKALKQEKRILPIDPYFLGYWLGDGTSSTSELTVGLLDVFETCLRLYRRGHIINYEKMRGKGNVFTFGIGQNKKKPSLSYHHILKDLDVLKNKHIPSVFLRASIEQRKDLLAGLMDSDGYTSGQICEYTTININLALGMLELVRSLGCKPVLHKGISKLNKKIIGPKYRITWSPIFDPFFLKRKSKKINFNKTQQIKHHHRMIKKFEKIENKPMKCITVNSPSSLFLAGEGMIPTHNTKTGAETIRSFAQRWPKTRWAMIAETADEARKVMLKGESGLLSCCAPWERPHFDFTDQCVRFKNGSQVFLYSAEKPEKFRGPQFHGAWLDEFPKWRRMQESWNNLVFGVRLKLPDGLPPKIIITTTPRPSQLLRQIKNKKNTVITIGTTYDNKENLAESFIDEIEIFKNTKLGRQEIFAEFFDEAAGASFKLAWIDKNRVKSAPEMRRIVIAVDPSSSGKENRDMTGICVAGLGSDNRAYILDDASIHGSPDTWGRRAVELYRGYGADTIVCETTMGGELVPTVLRLIDPNVPVKTKGGNKSKVSRAEPVAALYEQGRVSHVGTFNSLEDQMTTWTTGNYISPDRMDAMVYAVTELLLDNDQGCLLI